MNKTETALLYFPDSTPKVAVRHLMRWIARCAPLLHALEATGYHPCQKSFFCRQIFFDNLSGVLIQMVAGFIDQQKIIFTGKKDCKHDPGPLPKA